MDVVGFGENSIDYIYRLPALPVAGIGKLHVNSRSIRPGGQVATTMAACAALGLSASYVGTIGNDDGGRLVREQLMVRGVDVRHVIVRPAPTRYAAILVDERHGERIVLWDRDERLAVPALDIRSEWIAGARLLHVDQTDEAASTALAQVARAAGVIVTSDIEAVTPQTEALLEAVSVPIFAEQTPSALTGEADAERALRKLRARHKGMLVVTLGALGAMLLDGDDLHVEPAFPVKAVDTTGAGDVFRAGFIFGLLNRMTPGDTLRFACAAAAIACSRPGAMESVPTRDEVAGLMGG